AIALADASGMPALVLEDAGPQDLEQWLHRRSLAPPAFLRLAYQAAAILARLHQQGLIHGDVCPSNLVVGPSGERLTLIDLDTANAESALATTVPSELHRSLAYVAPEQTGR